ncbi:MAG: LPS export ABC transporter periplasmic protein LptC [Hyphomicrobium sp.]
MVSVSDSAGAGRSVRAAGSGIELAGDRSASRLVAARHTLFVRILKLGLPLSAILVVTGYAAVVFDKTGWGAGLVNLEIPKIVADNLAMENPHYEGFNNDGGRYWVTAKKAMQDLKNLSVIRLDTITGELIDANKERTKLTATRGSFNSKLNLIELFDTIDVTGDNGMTAHLTRATIKTKENIISSDQPVSVAMAAGTITARQMTIRQKSKEYTFLNDVQTNLKARQGDAAATPATGGATAFGNPNEPIAITATRLDVNDAVKTATFTGNVTAVQGGATLTSPELEVSYEGSAVPNSEAKGPEAKNPEAKKGDDKAAAAQPAEASGKVKRVVAKNPVTLSDGTGQQATSRSADFDAIAQKAVLEGDVVMSELPDKRATGDRAEIDQAANTVLLTGPVVVSQGTNELKGRRLFFNRATAKMNLTGAGSGNGRISARFSQASPSPKTAAEKSPEPARGVAFGGNFKTDPSAPIEVAAERLDVDDQAKQAVFTGDVKAQQAGFVLQAAELTASYTGAAALGGTPAKPGSKPGSQDAAKLTRIQAKKNVEVTSKDGQKATGDWADYDTRANTVVLGGDVVMTQGKNIVRGTKLAIDMTTGESVISTQATARGDQPWVQNGDTKAGGRPSAVFYPSEMKEKAAKPAEKEQSGWQSRSAPSQ